TLMNRGARLDEVIASVAPPAALAARPYLSPRYDEPEFIVRNLYRLYGGWWDGNPAHLKPPRDAALARELADLAGGAAALAARAETTADPRLMCELVELAYLAAPDDPAIAAIRTKIYTARAASERSVMARSVFTAAAAESQK
ncbi:MAG TPA: alkyl sulfatase dimerization domain-containing protein, partial [Kofleriaceae bacterium]